MTDIGKFIKERRNQLCLTQLEVANAVGVTEATVSRWESGNIPNMKRSRIASLAKVLKVQPSSLIEWDDDTPCETHPASSVTSHQNTLTLGAVVSGFRMQERMTIEQFAALSGLSAEDVAMLERHLDPKTGQPITPDLDVYAAVAKAMGTTTDELRFIANGTRDVPQEQKASYQLTDDEEKLIKVYRLLPTDKKEVLLIVASSMAGETENKKEVI